MRALLLLAACVSEAEPPALADENLCERLARDRGAECAGVRAFARWANNPLGHVELCIPDRYIEDAERVHGPSWPSDDDRFRELAYLGIAPKCFWCASPGANAFSGCWVPR